LAKSLVQSMTVGAQIVPLLLRAYCLPSNRYASRLFAR
jgi:hypothetical protein